MISHKRLNYTTTIKILQNLNKKCVNKVIAAAYLLHADRKTTCKADLTIQAPRYLRVSNLQCLSEECGHLHQAWIIVKYSYPADEVSDFTDTRILEVLLSASTRDQNVDLKSLTNIRAVTESV